MRFRVLGQLTVHHAGREVAITAARERTLLAILLLHAGHTVDADRLAEAIWPEDLTGRAAARVPGCVHRLRRLLAGQGLPESTVITDPRGYRITVHPDELDLTKFRRLTAQARTAVAERRYQQAVVHYRAGLELWRGPALAGLPSPPLRAAATALAEERLEVLQERFETELTAGHSGELVAELTALCADYPLQERLHHALMLALYRAGRPSDAAAAYRTLRQRLIAELGMEPGERLAELHRAILSQDPRLAPAPAASPAAAPAAVVVPVAAPVVVPPMAVPVLGRQVPRELPPDVPGFTGRVTALAELSRVAFAELSRAPAITVITGAPGVGKTALAVHWAHQVADRFPDGQLYLDLRGYDPGPPLRPIEILAALLRSLGVPPAEIPLTEAEASARYRSLLAERRVLIVLDNAGSATQVHPALPGRPGCPVLVTSRDRLVGLVARHGARRIALDVLPATEATALLVELLGEQRVRAEPTAAEELARACAQLPLALRIAAATLEDRRHHRIGSFVAELTDGHRLTALELPGDAASAVRATFDLSYHTLPAPARRLFGLLSLVPGPNVTVAAAAALAGCPARAAEHLLDLLTRANLLDEPAPGRYTCHDLLREYAGERLRQTEDGPARAAATQRLLHFYLSHCDAAARLLYPHALRLPVPAAVPVTDFPDVRRAHDWLAAEHANLLAAVAAAPTLGQPQLAWLLADSLRRYFGQGHHPLGWRSAAQTALAAAQAAQDPVAQAAARFSLADLEYSLGRYRGSIAHYEAAAELARGTGWGAAQAATAGNLGIVYSELGELDLAIRSYRQALAVPADSAPRPDIQAVFVGNLGTVERESGRLRQAADTLRRALATYRTLGSIAGEASMLTNLGALYHDLGRFTSARSRLLRALDLHREVGDRTGEVATRDTLAALHRDAGDLTEALAEARRCAALAEEMGDSRYQAEALNTLGSIRCHWGQVQAAVDDHRRALALARRDGSRWSEVMALTDLATARAELGGLAAAAAYADRAARLAEQTGYRVLTGLALTVAAGIAYRRGDLTGAWQRIERALASHRETGHRLGEVKALALVAQLRAAAGEPAGAAAAGQAVRELCAQLGAPVPHLPE